MTRQGLTRMSHRWGHNARTTLVVAACSALAVLAGTQPASADPARTQINIATFGDSQMQGQGNPTSGKFWRLFADDLAVRTGKQVNTTNYAHSGSTLTYRHEGTTDVVGGGSCERGFATPIEVSITFPSVLECQIPAAAASGTKLDLVLLNGCINDIGPLPSEDYRRDSNLISGTKSVDESIDRYCAASLKTAIQAAHALPGSPEVAVVGFYPVISQDSALRSVVPQPDFDKIVDRFAAATAGYESLVDKTISDLGAQSWATFVSAGFAPNNAIFAPKDLFYHGPDDPIFPQRAGECLPYLSQFPICPIVAIAHPNAVGSRVIADQLNQNAKIREWFATPEQ